MGGTSAQASTSVANAAVENDIEREFAEVAMAAEKGIMCLFGTL